MNSSNKTLAYNHSLRGYVFLPSVLRVGPWAMHASKLIESHLGEQDKIQDAVFSVRNAGSECGLTAPDAEEKMREPDRPSG